MSRIIISVIFLTIVFTGCGTKVKLGEYSKSSMVKSKNLPSADKLKATKSKVLITKFEVVSNRIATNANLGVVAASAVSNQLAKTNSVDVIKRETNYIDLKKEVEAAELSRELNIDTGSAEFLITGKVTGASFAHQFIQGRSWRDKNGKLHKSPNKFRYRGCSSGTIGFYKLPSMQNVKSVPFSRCSTNSENTQGNYGAKKRDDGLVQNSIQSAIRSISKSLKSQFTKKGYILEKRVDGKKTIFLTTLGKDVGAKESLDVYIYSSRASVNPISGEKMEQSIKIGEGEISNQISADSSWVVLEELDDGEEMKIGDFIKINY